jgi:hypothetical protein
MSQGSASAVQFTVGKIDAGVAILLSQDNHVIEFPSAMLPVCRCLCRKRYLLAPL